MNKQEAIKILKEFHDTSALFSVRTALETVFPELKESEDDRIRKTLIEYFNAYPKDYYGALKKSHIIAWLEKQGNNLVKNGYTDNKDIIKYADNYSHEIWCKLMDNFENIKDYHIGCNDVSDIVLNAIIDAYNWLEKQGTSYTKRDVDDAFIEKACQWLEDNKDHPFIECEDHQLAGFLTNEFIEEFKKYMKGE